MTSEFLNSLTNKEISMSQVTRQVKKKNTFLSKDELDFYNENGYLIIDNHFKKNELNSFKESYRCLIRSYLNKLDKNHLIKSGQEFDKGLFLLESIDHKYIAEIYDCSAQTPEFLKIISNKKTDQMIKLIMGLNKFSPLYTFTCRCRIDMPSDNRRTYGWHQEVFYTIPESDFVQTWAPLITDTDYHNGTIEICPKSHKEGVALQDWNDIEGKATQIIVKDEIVKKYNSIVCAMKLGQLLIFSGRLFHKSGENKSNKTRFSLVGMYHDATKDIFSPPKLSFNYSKKTPREYYDEFSSGGIGFH